MTFNEIYNFCEEVLFLLKDFGIRIIDFCSQEFIIMGSSFTMLQILFGTGLITFLSIAILRFLL